MEESHNVAEPMEDIPRMVVAIETPETEVIEESQLNGKSNSLLNSFRIIIYLFIFVLFGIKKVFFHSINILCRSQSRMSRKHLASKLLQGISLIFGIAKIVIKLHDG